MPRDVQIKIGAQDNASRVLQKVRGEVGTFGQAARNMARSVAVTGTAISGIAIGAGVAVKKMVDDFAEVGDLIHKTALRTKLSAEFLSQIAFAAEQSGTSLEQVSQALFRAFRRIGNAQTETGPAADALKELGLNAKELSQLRPEQIFFRLTDSLNALDDPLRRSQLGFEVFGDNWRRISPLIESGSEEIRNLMREAQNLGRSLSGEQVAQAAEYTDAMNELRSVLQGIQTDIATAVIPAFTELARAIKISLQGSSMIMREFEMSWLNFTEGFLTVFGGSVGTMLGPMKRTDNTDVALQVIRDRRNAVMAKQLASMFSPLVSDTIDSGLRGGFGNGSPAGSGSDSGRGDPVGEIVERRLRRIFNETPFTGNARSQGLFPALQSNQSRLMRFGNELSPAIGQGQKVINRMAKMEAMWEEFINGGKPPLPVKVDNEPAIELVKVN